MRRKACERCISKKLKLLDPSNVGERPCNAFAIPGHDSRKQNSASFSWHDEFSHPLPSAPLLDILINQYFLSVNWFMLVIDEDSFRTKIVDIAGAEQVSGSDRNFCLLAQLVCALGSHYLLTDPETSIEKTSLKTIKLNFLNEVQRQFFAILSEPDLETVQILILLGSFYLFNERPNVGYGVLGSCIKIAQLLGLHRASKSIQTNASDQDSQIQVWWALEIFEKYAAVAFGRPCGIDDSDCDVSEVEDMTPDQPLLCRSEGAITMLTYQKLKCRLYRIIGPFLGRRRESSDSRSLGEVHDNLLNWYQNMPTALSCKVAYEVFEDRPEPIQLQALALQLAYDNLQIVLHRQAVFATKASEVSVTDRQRSLEQLEASAARTATATAFKVAQTMSRSSHAAMHLGICLFTAGVVLCALNSTAPSAEDISKQHLESIDQITRFLKDFPGQQYGLAGQSYEVLMTLRSRYGTPPTQKPVQESHAVPVETILDLSGSQLDSYLELEHGANLPLQETFQSWLWTEE